MKHALVLLACALLAAPVASANAQTVTTAAITGLVRDSQGGVVPGATVTAVHVPSGTSYEGVSQADGRYYIPGYMLMQAALADI